jgi:hypothetical protein
MHRQFGLRGRIFVREYAPAKEIDDLKMLVVEVGIDRITQNESYRLLYYSIAGGDGIPRNQIYQCRLKTVVESNFEPCDHPQI